MQEKKKRKILVAPAKMEVLNHASDGCGCHRWDNIMDGKLPWCFDVFRGVSVVEPFRWMAMNYKAIYDQ